MTMRVLLVQPPRPLWPYINEQDNYLVPQWMVCLGAVLRQAGVQVHLLDCMPERMGWRSLERRLRLLGPDLVASGENHALFASSAVRLMRLARAVDPSVVTVLGGGHFTALAERYLRCEPVDFIVRGEGEQTLVELVSALLREGRAGGRSVPGVAFFEAGQVHFSPPRPLLEDLDALPMPAYDLLPMGRYGRARHLFSPGGTTLHHSRGCTGSCRFCAWWRQMARRDHDAGPEACARERLTPRWRTKSVERTLEEMELLHRRHHKRCLVFVDPTFNVDPRWNDAFAGALLRRGWDLVWFAFLRADFILRDEELGIFERLVRSGLTHLCVGVERDDDARLDDWGKPGARSEQYVRCFELLHRKYPGVFRQATFIVGTRDEDRRSMRAQLAHARRIRADYPAFHPVTPFPGTDLYQEALREGSLEVQDFDQYDMMTAILSTDHLSREEVEQALVELNRDYVSLPWLLRGLLSRSRYRRDMYVWWLLVTLRIFVDEVRRRANPLRAEPYTSSVLPQWYED